MTDDEAAADEHIMQAVVYIEERDARGTLCRMGYEAVVTTVGMRVERVMVTPLAAPEHPWLVSPVSATWQAVLAFVAARPELRARTAMPPARRCA